MGEARRHHIVLWDHQQMVSGDKPHDPYVMRVCGWACGTCREWGSEESPRRREHAIERHVAEVPDANAGSLVRQIERWWEEEADHTASCAAPDPALCQNHVFEEAVRVDGEIIACTVHGGRLARSLAAFLHARAVELEKQIREGFEERFRRAREGTWPTDEGPLAAWASTSTTELPAEVHKPGCMAGRDPAKRCICRVAEPRTVRPGALPPELRR